MESGRDKRVKESKAKKSPWSARVMPEFGGLRVVEVSRSEHFTAGSIFGWTDVSFQSHQGGMSAFITLDAQKQRMVTVLGGNRGTRLASRLKKRSEQRTAHEPVFVYEPKRESVRKYWIALVMICVLSLAGMAYFGTAASQKLSGQPWSFINIAGFLILTLPAWGCLLVTWMFFRIRPRNPQYDLVAVSELSFRLERDDGESHEIAWDKVVAHKRINGDQIRMRFDLVDGRRLWMMIPKRVRTDVLSRIPVDRGGVRADPVAERRAAYWFAMRFFLIGLVLSAVLLGLVWWLSQAGLILPADARRMAIFGTMLVLMHTWLLGLLLVWSLWRSTPKGRRTIRRWSRRLGQRFRCHGKAEHPPV